jgi:hypothetical protein
MVLAGLRSVLLGGVSGAGGSVEKHGLDREVADVGARVVELSGEQGASGRV